MKTKANKIKIGASLKILPCPFCGDVPEYRAGKIGCKNTQCKVQPRISAWYVNTEEFAAKAAADWNERFDGGRHGQ